jgi:hypothetical protein
MDPFFDTGIMARRWDSEFTDDWPFGLVPGEEIVLPKQFYDLVEVWAQSKELCEFRGCVF